MAITEKKPALKETVGAQYMCFNTMDVDNQWTTTYEANVEKTKVVKTVKVTENTDAADVYSSGEIYDSESSVKTIGIESEYIAFPDSTLAKMKGDSVDTAGLILSGGKRVRPYFAYGKVVKLKGGKVRYDWYPKCKLTENSDSTKTSEDKFKEQTDTIKITAYPFNDEGDIVAKVASDVNMPTGLTEDKFFTKPILTKEDLAAAVGTTGTTGA